MKAILQTNRNLLCGRDELVEQIVANCRAQRLSVISSEGGLGTTSLLQAGVAPALEREKFLAVYFDDWQGRFFASGLREAVASAIREAADPQFFAEGEALDRLLDRAQRRTGAAVVLLLDQFEDYVRCHANTELSDAFDAELANAVAARNACFVLGIQSHAIPAFDRLNQHIANLRGFELRLGPLAHEAGKQAAMGELEAAHLVIEPAALDAILTAPVLETQPGTVHPFFLKIALEVLSEAEHRKKSGRIGMATIEAFGGVERVVMEYLDPRVNELGNTQIELLFRWCNILISEGRHRLSVTEKGLIDYAGKFNRFAPPLLGRLVEMGILRSIDMAGTIRYEIARECLTPILRDWWERREAAIVARRRANFRIKSLTVAVSAILLMYVIWLFVSK